MPERTDVKTLPKSEETRRRILNAALSLFRSKGFEAATMREIDLTWFRTILADGGVRIPKDLEDPLPGILWFFQMGVIFFWVIDESSNQTSTARLLDLATKSVVSLIRISALPLMRPVRKTALELVDIVKGAEFGESLVK